MLLITLADPDCWELPFFSAGAHINLHLENGLRLAYSLCGDPHDRYQYQVAVKLAKEGRGGSRWIHTHFQPGKSFGVSLPRATMTLQQGMAKHVLIAGGIGITPMLSLVYVLEKQRQDYELHYFYRGAAPLLKQVKQAIRGGRLYLYPGDSVAQKKKRLADILPPWRADYCLYCCGPEPMMAAFNSLAPTWQPHQRQQEHFTGLAVDETLLPPYTIELRRSGKTIPVRSGQTPLQALLEADVYVDHACEGGICGACSVPWCDGEPIHRDKVLSPDERQRRVILCVAGCRSEKLVLDL